MYILYSVPGSEKARSLSPFAWKAEALLKLSGKPYRVEFVADLSKMPNGKVPVLQDGEQQIADSSLIQRYLEQKGDLALDHTLSAEQKAVAEAFRRMAEEHLYWVGVYARMVDPAGEAFVRNAMLAGLPQEVQDQVMTQLREGSRQQMHGHGIGRHCAEQIYAFGCQDVQAIADYLADKPFFFGDAIHSIDCVLATAIAGFLANPFSNPLTDYVRRLPNLVAYAERFNQTVFG